MWLGRNLSAFDASVADTGRVGSFAHISVWRILCLDEYRSNCASEGMWLELGPRIQRVKPRSKSYTRSGQGV